MEIHVGASDALLHFVGGHAGQDEGVPLRAFERAPERGRGLPGEPERSVLRGAHRCTDPEGQTGRIAIRGGGALEEEVVVLVADHERGIELTPLLEAHGAQEAAGSGRRVDLCDDLSREE